MRNSLTRNLKRSNLVYSISNHCFASRVLSKNRIEPPRFDAADSRRLTASSDASCISTIAICTPILAIPLPRSRISNAESPTLVRGPTTKTLWQPAFSQVADNASKTSGCSSSDTS